MMNSRWHWLLRCGIALSLFGLCLSHWVGEEPYRAILWDQSLMEPVIGLFGLDWNAWVTNTDNSIAIYRFNLFMGLLFFFMAVLALLPWRACCNRLTTGLFFLPLFLLGLARWAEHHYDLLWPFEFALRSTLPLFLLLVIHNRQVKNENHLFTCLLIACGLTFIGHGCYALNLYPTPLSFRLMVASVIPLSETGITILLYGIGTIDILTGCALAIPRLQRPVLLWMGIWGGLTALMRFHSVDLDFPAETIAPALAAWMERVPHFLIPLTCWYWLQSKTIQDMQPATQE